MTKRYKLDIGNQTLAGVIEHPEGGYVLATDYDALAAELDRERKWHAPDDLSRIRELEAALELFRHTRVRDDGPGPDEFVFTDLLNGVVCVVAYVRNKELADRFNAAFENVRAALSRSSLVELQGAERKGPKRATK